MRSGTNKAFYKSTALCCLSLWTIIAVAQTVPPTKPVDGSLPPPAREFEQELFGAHLHRSMSLLANSSKERRYPIRILLYGQSIVSISPLMINLISENLHARFPYADITIENRAIGGYQADRLVRTSVHDMYPFYPDLVIFHDYGGEYDGTLERMISNLRRYTTADILLFNDHMNSRQTEIPDFRPKLFRYLAEKYDCELVDVSTEWPRYLKENNIPASRLLRDVVHPNDDGFHVLITLILRHLQYNPLFPSGSYNTVRTYEAKRAIDEGKQDEVVFHGTPWTMIPMGAVGTNSQGSLFLKFDGNRIDAIAAHEKSDIKHGTARILIDGHPPSENSDLYAFTRPSKVIISNWPSINRIDHRTMPLVEDWTLKLTATNADNTDLRFTVVGSKTGPDGSGSNKELFVSNSGRVVIDPRDWTFAPAYVESKKTHPVGYEVHWSVVPMFTDVYKGPITDDPGKIYQTTLAQGLSNGPHTLEIIPNGDGPVAIESLQVYTPPLR